VKRIVLLVGVPGAGKTTLAQRLIDRGYRCFNADAIRQELFGDAGDQREPEKVFELFYQRLEAAMAAGDDIVIDNTNINTKHRSPILQRAIKAGYTDIQLWILDVPLETCLERNRCRSRAVPDDIVVNYFNTLQGHGKPRKHEGKLVVVRPGAKDFEYKFFQLK
jgi:predicted kinase